MNASYVNTVNLLLDIAPAVFATPRLAMKGGTALNLFVQEMPRLSVDIDVAFVDHEPSREAALEEIAKELQRMQIAISAMGYEAQARNMLGGDEVKIVAFSEAAQVKVEVNFVFRGTLLPLQTCSLSAKTQELFAKNIQAPLLATSELYGSKLVAALDRQHPRDFLMCDKCCTATGSRQRFWIALWLIWRGITGRCMRCCLQGRSR